MLLQRPTKPAYTRQMIRARLSCTAVKEETWQTSSWNGDDVYFIFYHVTCSAHPGCGKFVAYALLAKANPLPSRSKTPARIDSVPPSTPTTYGGPMTKRRSAQQSLACVLASIDCVRHRLHVHMRYRLSGPLITESLSPCPRNPTRRRGGLEHLSARQISRCD